MSSNSNPTKSNRFSEKFFTTDLFCNKNEIADYIWYLIREKNISKNSEIYDNADLSKQNWSNYVSGKNVPNPVNARKLVIGLKCTLDEAETLLALCGFQFVKNNIVDDCIKQCIKEKRFNMADVYLRIDECSKKVA